MAGWPRPALLNRYSISRSGLWRLRGLGLRRRSRLLRSRFDFRLLRLRRRSLPFFLCLPRCRLRLELLELLELLLLELLFLRLRERERFLFVEGERRALGTFTGLAGRILDAHDALPSPSGIA
mmetsp:Transcript_150691/g.262532  ORF Transcript_150691/g.262532 Transcript_150691/m.262532 type:complete len:123 (-) Transcript_150691:33-401(-)